MQKQNIHLHNCSQTDLKRPQKCSHGTNLFIKVKVQFLCIDFANHRSCTSKKVQIDPKTSLAGRSTGFGPNDMRPNFLGSFWWKLSHVSLHLKSKIIGCPQYVLLERRFWIINVLCDYFFIYVTSIYTGFEFTKPCAWHTVCSSAVCAGGLPLTHLLLL